MRATEQLVGQAAQARHDIKPVIAADQRFAIVACTTSDPVVIFAQPGAAPDQRTVSIRRSLDDAKMEAINCPELEPRPTCFRVFEQEQNFAGRNDRNADNLFPICGEKSVGHPQLAATFFAEQIRNEGVISHHERRERRRRWRRYESMTSTSTGGRAACSRAAYNSPAVLAGRWTCRKMSLVKESCGPVFSDANKLYAFSSMVILRCIHGQHASSGACQLTPCPAERQGMLEFLLS